MGFENLNRLIGLVDNLPALLDSLRMYVFSTVIIPKAQATVDTLNDLSGVNLNVDDNLFLFKLSPDHWVKMPNGDICDDIASRVTEYSEKYGPGVFHINDLPPEVHPVGNQANVHERCECMIVPLKAAMQGMSWQLVIIDDGIVFKNESEEVESRMHGTNTGVKKGQFIEGADPDNRFSAIIESFENSLQAPIDRAIQNYLLKVLK